MKRIAYFLLPLFLCACGEIELPDAPAVDDPTDVGQVTDDYTKKFTFTIKGDFCNPQFVEGDGEAGGTMRVGVVHESTDEWGDSNRMTRANQYMTADGVEMTDMWVVDVVGGEVKQMLHQTASDADWGAPTMSLTLGTHHVLFLASRGTGAAYSEGVVTWGKVLDTFYTDYEVTVAKTSNGNRAVTLDRVATKMTIAVTDAVLSGTTTIAVTPSRWFDGWNMLSGEPVASAGYGRTFELNQGQWGATDLELNVWGLSGKTEWTADVDIVAKAGDAVNASATIADAPFVANRITRYSGSLWSQGGNNSVSLSGEWLPSYEGVY